MEGKKLTRRLAIKRGIAAAAGIVASAPLLLSASRSRAADLPKVSEDDSTAKALNYTHDASTNSAREDSTQLCANCLYFKGSAEDEWARCDLFPGKVVADDGWCTAWSAKG